MRRHFTEGTEGCICHRANQDIGDKSSKRTSALQSMTGTQEKTGTNGTSDLTRGNACISCCVWANEQVFELTYSNHLYMSLFQPTLYAIQVSCIELELS